MIWKCLKNSKQEKEESYSEDDFQPPSNVNSTFSSVIPQLDGAFTPLALSSRIQPFLQQPEPHLVRELTQKNFNDADRRSRDRDKDMEDFKKMLETS